MRKNSLIAALLLAAFAALFFTKSRPSEARCSLVGECLIEQDQNAQELIK